MRVNFYIYPWKRNHKGENLGKQITRNTKRVNMPVLILTYFTAHNCYISISRKLAYFYIAFNKKIKQIPFESGEKGQKSTKLKNTAWETCP